MATLRKSHNRQNNSISTRVLESLTNTPGLSDNEICRRIGVDVQKGTQSRYKLYRDGKIIPAGSRSCYGRIVKTWKIADDQAQGLERKPRINVFKAQGENLEPIAQTSNTSNLGAKLEWLSKIYNKYPDLVDTIVPITNRDGLLSAVQDVESILSHPFNYLLGSNE
jgi:hypothetical protein